MDTLMWRARLDSAETAEVLELIAAVTEADGTGPVSEHVLLHLRHGGDAEAVHLLARAEAGTLAGYAHLDVTDKVAGGAAELAVRPEYRRHGVGTRLVQALLDRVATPGCPAEGRLRLWAHGGHPGAVALAEHFGFRQARVLWQMRRSLLAPLPEPDLPAGVRLRTFQVGQDEQAFIEVNNRAFAWHPEQSGWEIEQLKLRQAEPWFDADGFLLAVSDTGDTDRLLGFHWTKVHGHDGQHEPIGEVYVVGVDPDQQGRRLGRELTLAGLRYLRDRGLRQVMLYVEADNEAAIRVYERLGFTHWDTDVSYLR